MAKAASATKEYRSAYIRDYALILHGNEYTAGQLETLPQPSSLAIRRTDNVLVFFSKYSVLSNHFPSTFTLQDKTFYSVEHYLAFRKAQISQQQFFIQKASDSRDPVEAKSILHSLRKDHEQVWKKERYGIALTGIRAKFTQNKHLSSYLRHTDNLQLGEASKDASWGIGMTLEDKEVTAPDKWNQEGNLLGKVLMQIRAELNQNVNGSK